MSYPAPFDSLPETACRARDMGAGDLLFRQGENSSGLWLVLDGEVHLVRHGEAGHRVVLARAAAGQTLAEASLFAPTYHCDAEVVAPGRAVRFRKQALLQRIDRDPGFARALMQRLARQVQASRRQVELLSIRSAEDRVLAALADGGQTGTVMALAAQIGLTHEATYRALAALVRRGLAQKLGRGRYQLSPV
ncbi:Crp/Fnr family transcriptional regulator [Aestuariicoccus sp. MJ-SS9]|uniref:Crp/Fnr family transcriptional regulator n=1 Tax=Aestuariicoccus sp. MJ-SS9 TaxID=3079855 RepID=UPI00290D3660|nr:Crp/Fnr family transcriptional regulator [Aestuariicoccus sp. MJ-SS9]MDU8912013.1 Crp/Fnr family transcriptional regulator [Aestuariicoccus sp. MJ-SS9]